MTVREGDVHDCDPVRQGHVSAFLVTSSEFARESLASQFCSPTTLMLVRFVSLSLCLYVSLSLSLFLSSFLFFIFFLFPLFFPLFSCFSFSLFFPFSFSFFSFDHIQFFH